MFFCLSVSDSPIPFCCIPFTRYNQETRETRVQVAIPLKLDVKLGSKEDNGRVKKKE